MRRVGHAGESRRAVQPGQRLLHAQRSGRTEVRRGGLSPQLRTGLRLPGFRRGGDLRLHALPARAAGSCARISEGDPPRDRQIRLPHRNIQSLRQYPPCAGPRCTSRKILSHGARPRRRRRGHGRHLRLPELRHLPQRPETVCRSDSVPPARTGALGQEQQHGASLPYLPRALRGGGCAGRLPSGAAILPDFPCGGRQHLQRRARAFDQRVAHPLRGRTAVDGPRHLPPERSDDRTSRRAAGHQPHLPLAGDQSRCGKDFQRLSQRLSHRRGDAPSFGRGRRHARAGDRRRQCGDRPLRRFRRRRAADGRHDARLEFRDRRIARCVVRSASRRCRTPDRRRPVRPGREVRGHRPHHRGRQDLRRDPRRAAGHGSGSCALRRARRDDVL